MATRERRTTSAIALEELKRRGDQESLRRYLINEGCFPSTKDPSLAPITLEELKKLVRVWKLNEQRNFWKSHQSSDEIVRALLSHATQLQNYSNKKPIEPVKPLESKPSFQSIRLQHHGSSLSPRHLGKDSQTSVRNFCGLKYFNRENNPSELTISSRFFTFPNHEEKVEVVVNKWRSEDFNASNKIAATLSSDLAASASLDEAVGGMNNRNSLLVGSGSSTAPTAKGSTAGINSTATVSASGSAVTSHIKNKVKTLKQRNLALHLMNYSAYLDFKKTPPFTVKTVQTFINVAESDDAKTVSHCMIALSNIGVDSTVRAILFEINAMHKITNMLSHLRGRPAHWAAALLFYYFSCDKETEDRVYSASSGLLAANGHAKDPQVRLIALYTLNNLMTCIDRQRVAETTLRILMHTFDPSIIFQDRELTSMYLTILQNMSWFSNVQTTLINLGALSLLEQFAAYAVAGSSSSSPASFTSAAASAPLAVGRAAAVTSASLLTLGNLLSSAVHASSSSSHTPHASSGDIALSVTRILMSFLQLPEQAAHTISFNNQQFVTILMIIIGYSDHEGSLLQALKAALVISSVANLRKIVNQNTELTKMLCNMLINRPSLSNQVAKEAAKYLCNITLAGQSGGRSSSDVVVTAAAGPSSSSSVIAHAQQQQLLPPYRSHHEQQPSQAAASSPPIPVVFDGSKYLDDRIAEAIFAILRSTQVNVASKSIAIRALQNIVSYAHCGLQLVNQCLDPMIRFLRDNADPGAAQVLYNLSCIPECRQELVDSKVHSRVLDFMVNVKDGFPATATLKSAFLQILVQLSSSNVCVLDLLKLDLISKLDGQLKHMQQLEVWRDISLMLLAVVAYAAHELSYENQRSLLQILLKICVQLEKEEHQQHSLGTMSKSTASSSKDLHTVDADEKLLAQEQQQLLHRQQTSEEIVENCANVLKFVSAHFDSFVEMNAVIRMILSMGMSVSNEEIIDNISNVLYNLTCYQPCLQEMLEGDDAFYVNVMIRILRNGKPHIQENIAHSMRTLCSMNKCSKLLMKQDLLSDLIVIALLRTSNEEIKIVCSQAFYNMLCHDDTRLDLLKGDLWWALMRLGRTDSQAVRAVCVRALSDLSAPINTAGLTSEQGLKKNKQQLALMQALRDHHVLSFMKDLSTASSPELLLQCLQVVHNLLDHFLAADQSEKLEPRTALSASSSSSPPSRNKQIMSAIGGGGSAGSKNGAASTIDVANENTAAHEIAAVIRLAADAFHRAPTLKCVRIATILLLKCAQLGNHPLAKIYGVDNEFVNLDFVDTLKASRLAWSQHPECRLNISRLIFELTKSKAFAKATMLADISPVLFSCYLPAGVIPPVGKLAASSATISLDKEIMMEVCENIIGSLLQFLLNSGVDTSSSITAHVASSGMAASNPNPHSGVKASSQQNVQQVSPASLLSLEIWPIVLKEGLSCNSSILPKHVSVAMKKNSANSSSGKQQQIVGSGSGGGNVGSASYNDQRRGTIGNGIERSGRATMYGNANKESTTLSSASSNLANLTANSSATLTNETFDGLHGSAPQPLRIQGMALSLFAYAIEEMLATNSKLLTEDIFVGIITAELMDHNLTRSNLLTILQVCSHHADCANYMISYDLFILVGKYISSATGSSRFEKAQELGTSLLRNFSLHPQLIHKLVSIPNGALLDFVRDLVDVIDTRVSLDISIFFFHTANSLVQSEAMLNPKFILEMINKTSSLLGDRLERECSDVVSIDKYVISMILNKYSFIHGVEPSFIQNMFIYMQSTALNLVPDLMSSYSGKHISDMKGNLVSELVALKETIGVDLMHFPASEEQWHPIINTQIKQNETVILKFSKSLPISFEKLEVVESNNFVVFTKILKMFDPVRETKFGLTREDTVISEGNEHEEDEDDNDEIAEREDFLHADVKDTNEQETKAFSNLIKPEGTIDEFINKIADIDVQAIFDEKSTEKREDEYPFVATSTKKATSSLIDSLSSQQLLPSPVNNNSSAEDREVDDGKKSRENTGDDTYSMNDFESVISPSGLAGQVLAT